MAYIYRSGRLTAGKLVHQFNDEGLDWFVIRVEPEMAHLPPEYYVVDQDHIASTADGPIKLFAGEQLTGEANLR